MATRAVFFVAPILALAATLAPAAANPPGDGVATAMVQLYEQRLALVGTQIDAAKRQQSFDDVEYQRVLQLYNQNAAALEELQDKERVLDLAGLKIKELEGLQQEAQLKLNIVRLRPDMGMLTGN